LGALGIQLKVVERVRFFYPDKGLISIAPGFNPGVKQKEKKRPNESLFQGINLSSDGITSAFKKVVT